MQNPWDEAKKTQEAARRRAQSKRRAVKQTVGLPFAVSHYNAALDRTAAALQNADPRPGHMTEEQEQAQCSLVNAWLEVEKQQDKGEGPCSF